MKILRNLKKNQLDDEEMLKITKKHWNQIAILSMNMNICTLPSLLYTPLYLYLAFTANKYNVPVLFIQLRTSNLCFLHVLCAMRRLTIYLECDQFIVYEQSTLKISKILSPTYSINKKLLIYIINSTKWELLLIMMMISDEYNGYNL